MTWGWTLNDWLLPSLTEIKPLIPVKHVLMPVTHGISNEMRFKNCIDQTKNLPCILDNSTLTIQSPITIILIGCYRVAS
jgi:hypothetical protein